MNERDTDGTTSGKRGRFDRDVLTGAFVGGETALGAGPGAQSASATADGIFMFRRTTTEEFDWHGRRIARRENTIHDSKPHY